MKHLKALLISSILLTYCGLTYAKAEAYSGKIGIISDNTDWGSKFNDFMMQEGEERLVELDITLSQDQASDFERSPDEFNRIIFTEADFSMGVGVEYLIHLSNNKSERHFTYANSNRKLKGCFMITEIAGPHQGIMSVNLKSVECK